MQSNCQHPLRVVLEAETDLLGRDMGAATSGQAINIHTLPWSSQGQMNLIPELSALRAHKCTRPVYSLGQLIKNPKKLCMHPGWLFAGPTNLLSYPYNQCQAQCLEQRELQLETTEKGHRGQYISSSCGCTLQAYQH